MCIALTIDSVHDQSQAFPQSKTVEYGVVGIGRDGKATGNIDTQGHELLNHFSQRSGLASDARQVLETHLFEGQTILVVVGKRDGLVHVERCEG